MPSIILILPETLNLRSEPTPVNTSLVPTMARYKRTEENTHEHIRTNKQTTNDSKGSHFRGIRLAVHCERIIQELILSHLLFVSV